MSRKDLTLAGKLDALILTKYSETIPCELKLGHPYIQSPPIWDKMQLAAYAILVEGTFGNIVRRGIIYYIKHQRTHLVKSHGV
ncbi:MAG: Dna2/Cas4 domain-containing protein [Nitrososphaerota archaeon]